LAAESHDFDGRLQVFFHKIKNYPLALKSRGGENMRESNLRTIKKILVIALTFSLVLGLGAQASLAVKGGHCSSASSLATSWYLAEGFTGDNFDTYILLSNFSATTDSLVRVSYMREDGTVIRKKYTIKKNTRYSIHVDDIPELADTAFSTVVDVLPPGPDIVVERAMYFDYGGRTGGHATAASPLTGSVWYFAEGFTGGDFDTYILLENPNPTNDAEVKVTYMKQDGTTVEQNLTVVSESRYTIHVDELAGMSDTAFSTKVAVQSGPDIVAERSMYFDYGDRIGGHTNIGLEGSLIDNKYYLAEGYTGSDFDTYVLLSNPSDTTDATVDVTFVKPDGAILTETYNIGKHSRHTIHVDEIPGFSDVSFGTTIETSVGQVVAERAMYFNYEGKDGGHVASATPDGLMDSIWYLAEGYTGGGFDTWLLLFNPSTTTDAQVRVSFVQPDGTSRSLIQEVPKQSRRSIYVDSINGMEDMAFGTKTEVISGPNVVLERAMYFDYPIE
jgi:hypothetical protein